MVTPEGFRTPMKPIVFNAAVCLLASAFTSNESMGQPIHQDTPADLVVEHAEMLPPTPGGRSISAYLTIWNGTRQQADLKVIESEIFGKISIVQGEIGQVEASSGPLKGFVSIPSQAELLMKPDGVHLLLGEPNRDIEPGDITDLVLNFDGGRRIAVKVEVLASGDQITDHHHGGSDRPGVE